MSRVLQMFSTGRSALNCTARSSGVYVTHIVCSYYMVSYCEVFLFCWNTTSWKFVEVFCYDRSGIVCVGIVSYDLDVLGGRV